MRIKTKPVRNSLISSMLYFAPLPFIKGKYVDRPLRKHLEANRRSEMSAAEYFSIACRHGIGAPFRASKLITKFVDEKKSCRRKKDKIPKEKTTALKMAARQLKSTAWAMLPFKGLFYYGICAFIKMGLIAPGNLPEKINFDDFSPPLEIVLTTEADAHTLYGGNKWNPFLREVCADYFQFRRENVVARRELEQCFSERRETPLFESGFPRYLHYLEGATVVITPAMQEESREAKNALAEAESPVLQAESTGPKEGAMAFLQSGAEGRVNTVHFAQYYRRIYVPDHLSIPQVRVPQSIMREEANMFLDPDFSSISYVTPVNRVPLAYRVIEQAETGDPVVKYFPLRTRNVLYSPTGLNFQEAFAILHHFSPDIDLVADILYKYHGDELTHGQLKMLVQGQLMVVQNGMLEEDPWQDIPPIRSSGSLYADNFLEVFSDVDYGVSVRGMLVRPPWRLTSALFAPVPKQGFGPYQIILGLFEEAGQNQKVRSHWEGHLEDSDFADRDAMWRAIFDKPTLSCALVYDYVISQLRETTFADPHVRMPSNFPPFFTNTTAARQFALMNASYTLVMYPEREADAFTFLTTHDNLFYRWSLFAEALGEPPLFPDAEHRPMTLPMADGTEERAYITQIVQ